MSEVAGFLEWTKGHRGFVPHKRAVDRQPPKDAPPVVDRYELNAEQFAMTVAILEQRFPCRAKLEDEPKVKLEAGNV